MINDKLLPIIRVGNREDMPELKPGQQALIEGPAVNFDELYVGTKRGNSLINPRTVVKTGDEPEHAEGLAWIELDRNGKPSFDFAWVSKDGKWVSEQLYEVKLSGTSQSDIVATSLLDIAYAGVNGFEPAVFVEEMRMTIVSDVEDEEPMGHNLIEVALGGMDPFSDENAIGRKVQGSQLSGKTLRRSFDLNDVVTLADHPVFGLNVRASGGVAAFSSALGTVSYRLMRELPEVAEAPEEPAEEPAA